MIKLFRQWLDRYFSDPQLVMLVFLLAVGFVLIFLLGRILMPLLIAIVIAYLLDGMAQGLAKVRVPRFPAVLVVFVIFITSVLVLLIWLLPLISRQIAQLIQLMPSMIVAVKKELMGLTARYPEFITEAQINHLLGFIGSELNNLGQNLVTWSLASVRGLITVLVYFVLVPLMVFFFLKDKEMIIKWFVGFLPDHRGLADQVWEEVNNQLGNYIRGKIWEILIVWSISYVAFTILNLQFALLLSMFVGLSVLVPYIGATVMYLPVTLVAFFQWGWGADFIYVLLVYSVIQFLDGNLLVPLLLSEVVDLHPVAIIAAVLLFGGLWGMVGLFFAIPLATLIHSVIKAWERRQISNDKNEGPGDSVPESR
jgi:putative permease